MAYTDVFGGETIFPSLLSYIQITFGVDITLQWPREQQIGGSEVVADFMDMDATAVSLSVDMPSASATGTGNKATFNNIGANSFTVRDSAGGTIVTIAPGEQWIVVLTDNTTAAGTWTSFQLGATVSVSNAGALAGAGIKAISTTLNQKIDSVVEAATPFTVVDSDRANCSIYTSGAGTCNLPSPGAVGNDWFFMIRNSGSGTLNVVPPSGVIDGGASINLDPDDSAFIFTDGTDFFTIGLSSGSTIAFDFVQIAVPGSGDFILSGANLNRISYRFTGALTGNRRIVVPNTTQQYWVDNQTTGAFTLEVVTAAGLGQTIQQGESAIVYSDGTDVINAVSSTSVTFPITIGQGGTSATTASGARTNLDVPPNSRTFSNGAGIAAAGLGDLSADRTINAEIATESQIGVAELATQAEANAGTDDLTIITPLKLRQRTRLPFDQALATLFDFTNQGTQQTFFTTDSLDSANTYLIEFEFRLVSTTGGWVLQFDPPAGSTSGYVAEFGTATTTLLASVGAAATIDTQASGGSQTRVFRGAIHHNGSSTGALIFTVAQQSADGNSSSVTQASYIRVTRLT